MFQRLRWQLFVTLAGLLLVAGFLINLVNTQSQTTLGAAEAVYREGLAGRVQTVNPLLWETNAEQDLVSLVFSGLTRIDEHGQIVADLAEDWTVMDDGLTYAFTIREDARWHDGEPVTADDVLFTIGLLQEENSDLLPDQASLWRTVTVDKLDQRTLRFSLSEPLAPFLDYTTLPLLPAHLLSNVTAQTLPDAPFNQAPIGTGPFRLVEMDQEHIELEPFEDYYGPQPYISGLEFQLYPNTQSLLPAYEAGEIQGISRISIQDLDAAGHLDHLAIYAAQQPSCVALFLNLDDPALQDRDVRRALLMGLDRRALIDQHLSGQGVVANSPIIPGSWAHNPNTPAVQHDVETARELLEEAGWLENEAGVRAKDNLQMDFQILTNNDPLRKALAESIAQQWAAIGVRASVQTTNISTLWTQYLQPREFDLVLYGWMQTSADPDPYPLWHSSQIEDGQNYAGLDSYTIDNLLEAGRRTTDVEERRRAYFDFQRVFAEELPALLLYYPVYHYGVDQSVQNVQIPQTIFRTSSRFQTLYRWYIGQGRG